MGFNKDSAMTEENLEEEKKRAVEFHSNKIRELKHDIVNLQIQKENIELFLKQKFNERNLEIEEKEKEIINKKDEAEKLIQSSLIARNEAVLALEELHQSADKEQNIYENNKAHITSKENSLLEKELEISTKYSDIELKNKAISDQIEEINNVKNKLEEKESLFCKKSEELEILKVDLQKKVTSAKAEQEKYISLSEEARLAQVAAVILEQHLLNEKNENAVLKVDLQTRINKINDFKIKQEAEARELKALRINLENKAIQLRDIQQKIDADKQKLEELKTLIDNKKEN